MKTKKAQAWGFDLMIAAIIFVAGIILFYIFVINNSHETEETLNSLQYDGNNIGDNLLSEGYPENWDAQSVIRIGLLSQDKINETKLERFYNLVQSDYNRTKFLLNTKNNYYIQFSQNITINDSSIEFIGMKPDNPDNVIKVTRLVVYRNNPVIFNINVWN